MVQIGARNMDNRALLEAAAASGRPILLKRGVTATVDEVLAAAEFIVVRGNDQVVICERGSRTFEPSTRNSLDIAAVPEIKLRSQLPVVVDPSHGTGRRDLVAPVALAGIAAGADGVIVEVHPDPDTALSDGSQSIEAATFGAFMDRLRGMAFAVGRSV
jgi:3-deoxy-7-phosphoheptulonate synthase